MSEPIYIPLRAHSEFSIADGTLRMKEWIAKAVEYQYPALGLTDLMNTFGLIKFYKACRNHGIKPIMGADVRMENVEKPDSPYRALILVRNHAGYIRLCELLTAAYTADDRNTRTPQLRESWIEQGDNSGLLCLSGAHLGEVGTLLMNNAPEQAKLAAQKYQKWFGDAFYLELQRLPEKPEWEISVSGSLQLAHELDLPVVATHPTQFLDPDDYRAHDARVCIAGGWVLNDKKRPQDFSASQSFISPDEMAQRFHDIPEALANSVEIAKRCNLTLTLGKNFLPDFPTPNGMDLNDYITLLANEGLQERLCSLFPDESEYQQRLPEYQARLDFELKIIIQMGFSGYFLIVQDFINWAKNHGCPVGPGRGSGAGCLVAYSLKITDLDPIKYALLFERFLNPERVSMPDFDIDFCQANRGRVIEYVREKYGKDAVSQIVTFGTMSSKAVLRDVGRVLDLPFGLYDRLSKLIPLKTNKPLSLADAMESEPEIARQLKNEDAWELMDLAQKLEDLTRGSGMHAGGVLIAPGKISNFCPVYRTDESTAPVSMFDKDDVESIGLVKFDFLGLRNLTIIEMAQTFIKKYTTKETIDVNNINIAPLDDQATYQIFRDANTTAVFQFESAGMKKMLQTAHTTKFEELIAFVSLYRPGPMENIPDFVARMKNAEFTYLHPLLEPVLKPTYGIMVYQEQVMQTAQVIAGYSLGEADLLRRAMGKKKADEMAQHREKFAQGAAKQGIDRAKADEIFDYMEKFAEYGFNKSHAAAYAYISFQTAWLKAHYPAEFMAATMSSELDNTEQLKIFFDDAQNLNGITFLPPDINQSRYHFTPDIHKNIRYALGAIKGVGESAVESIIAARENNGAFVSLFDFCERVGKQHVNRRTIESLIRAGAFDLVEPNRAMLLANVELAMNNAEQKAENANQNGLFDTFEDAITDIQMLPEEPWSEERKLAEEKTAIGFYLSGHPFTPHEKEVRKIAPTPLSKLSGQEKNIRIAGFATSVRTIMTKKGKMVAILLEDNTAKHEIIVSGDLLEQIYAEKKAQSLLRADQILVLDCRVREDTFNPEGGLRIHANQIFTLDQAQSHYANSITLFITPQHDICAIAELLQPTTQTEDNKIPLHFHYENDHASGSLIPDAKWRISLNGDILHNIKQLLGERNVSIEW